MGTENRSGRTQRRHCSACGRGIAVTIESGVHIEEIQVQHAPVVPTEPSGGGDPARA